MIYFTSDTHFGHSSVIDFCKRPFKNRYEMDETLIRYWNYMVKENDTVYHLGDFSFHGATTTKEIIKKLNGHKILVRGNHDQKCRKYVQWGFDLAVPNASVRIKDRMFRLSHYPFAGTTHDHRDFTDRQIQDNGVDFLLHGHVHEKWKRNGRMLNVGVDVWNFTPVSEIGVFLAFGMKY